MKPTIRALLICVLSVFSTLPAFAISWDYKLSETPMLISGYNKSTNLPFFSFYNVLSGGFLVNFDDAVLIEASGKYTYYALATNSVIYVDRLNIQLNNPWWNLKLGRLLFLEGNGLIIGNLADGLSWSSGFLGFRQRLYALYSGFLPSEVNFFNLDSEERAGSEQRLSAGIVLEKTGILEFLNTANAQFFASLDLSTNSTYNPMYAGVQLKGTVTRGLTWDLNGYYQFGSWSSNSSISAYAVTADIIWLALENPSLAVYAGLTAASGSTTNDPSGRFQSSGLYNTGFVLFPSVANIFIAKAGIRTSLLDDNLSLKLQYQYMSRMNTNDNQGFLYAAGSGPGIGNEFALQVRFNLDAQISLFASGGFLLKGDALQDDPDTVHKIIAGTTLRF